MGTRIFNCMRKQLLDEFLQKTRITGLKNISTVPKLLSSTKEAVIASATSKTLPKNISDERDFLVRLKTDPDTFGVPEISEIETHEDLEEERYFSNQPLPSQKLRIPKYAAIIKKLISERKIKEALDVVEVRMIKEDRVQPDSYIYNLLLGACGRVGYTKKAFMLYNDMKKRGLNVTGGTYTALFNACANSPWPLTDGRTRLLKLYDTMVEKGYEPNESNYNAMIKAFGRCGDLQMAFTLVDNMTSKQISLHVETINFLLQACISDKEAGFRHALLVWRKLTDKNIKPDIYTFNLMLRCIRDCGLGDLEVTQEVINKLRPSQNDIKLLDSGDGNKVIAIEPDQNQDSEDVNEPKQLTVTTESHQVPDLRPNLMADTPHLGNIISLSEIKSATDRLLLVGGCRSFLENMKRYNCQGNIKTFTQLLDMIPNSEAAEKDLMGIMKKTHVRYDVDFFNMLIKRRSMRGDYEKAKEVLDKMDKLNMRPDLITYGVLAIGCKTKQECLDLIEIMKAFSYRVNAEILGAMLHQACYHFNFFYVLEVMELCLREEVKPNKSFMEKLSKFRNVCRDQSFKKQFTERQEQKFHIFKMRYKTWLDEVQVDTSEDLHPWQQFRQENNADAKYYKWKDSESKFKPKHTSYFRNKLPLKEWKQKKKLELQQKK